MGNPDAHRHHHPGRLNKPAYINPPLNAVGNPEFFPPVPGSLEGVLLAESLLVLLTSTDSQTLVSSLLCIFSPSHIGTAHLLFISPENCHSQKDIIPPIFIE